MKNFGLFVAFTLICFALSPNAQAVIPAPDGCYPGLTTVEGCFALFSLTGGQGNTAIGHDALFSDTTGSWNTAIGAVALGFNNGDFNTAVGTAALLLNTSGGANTANGALALLHNDTGSSNTAVGNQALFATTTGSFNTATGSFALTSNSIGSDNTAIGAGALENNTGSENTSIGSAALLFSTTGSGNTANGFQALVSNVDGNVNTAIGWQALHNNTSGSDNIALGAGAGSSLTTGDHNIYIDDLGGSTESDTIAIGARSATGTTYTQCFIGGIFGQPGGANDVFVSSTGKLGFFPSSRRYKDEIKPMDKTSEVIYALKPVSFRYKAEIEPMRPVSFGLIAEDVEEVNPDLVTRGDDGKINSVRYQAVNAMLLNEFLKEHRKNEEQEATIARQQKQIDALAAGLQKVNAQLEVSKPAPQVVNNP